MAAPKMMQRSVFYWVTSEDGPAYTPHSHEMISTEEVVNSYGVPLYQLEEHVELQIHQADSCKSLPFTILLVVSYATMAINHMNAPFVRAVENSVMFDIEDNANFAFDALPFMGHKTYMDVNSYTDFFSFMQVGLLPLLFIQEQQWGEYRLTVNKTTQPGIIPTIVLPTDEWGLVVNYNRVVGGIRLRQERAQAVPCSSNAELNKFYGRPCLAEEGMTWYDADPTVPTARVTNANETKTEWLWMHKSFDQVTSQLVELEASKWLDDMTTKVEVGIPIYNGEYDLHVLVNVNFYFSRGGHIWKHIVTQFCYTRWFTAWYHWVADILYALCIIWIFVNELFDVGSVVAWHGPKAILTQYVGLWNTIDWVSVITGVWLMQWFVEVSRLSDSLNQAGIEVGKQDRQLLGNDVPEVRVYMERLEEAVLFITSVQRWLARYPCIVVFRLFKAFHAQPRLAIVTQTIQECFIDLLHFMFVCICVYLGFLASAVILFGRDVEELSTVERAMIYCFRLMLADLSFDEMRPAGRVFPAAIYIQLFCAIVTLMLMNMLLSIVMEAYVLVKGNTTSTITIWEQTRRILFSMRRDQVPLSVVLGSIRAAYKEKIEEVADEDDDPEFEMERRFRRCIFIPDLIGLVEKHQYRNKCRRCLCFCCKGDWVLREDQAMAMLSAAVDQYFVENQDSANEWQYISLSAKVEQRYYKCHMRQKKYDNTKVILKTKRKRASGEVIHKEVDVKEMLFEFGDRLRTFLHRAQHDRHTATKEIARLEKEIAALREWVAAVTPPSRATSLAGRESFFSTAGFAQRRSRSTIRSVRSVRPSRLKLVSDQSSQDSRSDDDDDDDSLPSRNRNSQRHSVATEDDEIRSRRDSLMSEDDRYGEDRDKQRTSSRAATMSVDGASDDAIEVASASGASGETSPRPPPVVGRPSPPPPAKDLDMSEPDLSSEERGSVASWVPSDLSDMTPDWPDDDERGSLGSDEERRKLRSILEEDEDEEELMREVDEFGDDDPLNDEDDALLDRGRRREPGPTSGPGRPEMAKPHRTLSTTRGLGFASAPPPVAVGSIDEPMGGTELPPALGRLPRAGTARGRHQPATFQDARSQLRSMLESLGPAPSTTRSSV